MLNLITVRLLLRSTSNHFQTQGGRNVDPELEFKWWEWSLTCPNGLQMIHGIGKEGLEL